MPISRELQLIFSVSGIFVCYMCFAILQEKVTKTKYGENGDRFTFTFCLLFTQCVFSALSSLFQLIITPEKKPHGVPQTKYATISFSYLLAMFSSNAALNYVDYPTQVLAKTCKPIPVMIIGVLFMSRKYRWYQWTSVFFLVFGITIFLYKDNVVNDKEYNLEYLYGVSLLLLSLTCDGFTGPLQDAVFSKHQTSPVQMMFYNNLYAAIYCFIGMIVTGQGIRAIEFCNTYPEVIYNIILFSFASAIGQNFIYYTIFHFSSLICTISTTSRKFFTILASVLIFGHNVLFRQWVGVFLVFFGIGLEITVTYYHKWRLTNNHRIN